MPINAGADGLWPKGLRWSGSDVALVCVTRLVRCCRLPLTRAEKGFEDAVGLDFGRSKTPKKS